MDRPEHTILLACARTCSDAERSELMRAGIQEDLDWDYLLDTSALHRVSCMLYRQLLSVSNERVPSSILERLQKYHLKVIARNLFLTNELFKILDLFDREGIPAIPFKGPVLAHTLYKDPALREFRDLDILVQKQDVFRALKLLPEIGYSKIPVHSRAVEFRILDQLHNFPLEKENGQPLVELHWNIVPGFYGLPLPLEEWWTQAEFITVQSRRIRSFRREDHFVALCVHGCKHAWKSLAWIADIGRFLDKHSPLKWDDVFGQCGKGDLQRMLFVTLNVCHDLAGLTLPPKIIESCKKDRTALKLADEIGKKLFKEPEKASMLLPRLSELKFKTTIPGRIRFILRYISRPALGDWSVPLPKLLFPLYYILRPIRVLLQYISGRP